MRKHDLFGISLLLCVSPGIPGQTPEGAHLVVTSTVRAGETATGSVVGPDGSVLRGVVLEVDGERQRTDAQGHFPIPVPVAAGNRVSVLLHTSGDASERLSLPVLEPVKAPAPVVRAAPTRVLTHENIRVAGEGFSPAAGRNTVTLGGAAAPVLASSGGELVVSPSSAAPGTHRLEIRTPEGETSPRSIEVIRVSLRDADTKLVRGKRGDATIALEGTHEPLRLEIVNEAPQVIRLSGGDRQVTRSSGGGNNVIRLRYQGISPGDFRLSVHLAEGEASEGSAPNTDSPQKERRAATKPVEVSLPTAPVPIRTRKCVQFPLDIRIDDWDVIGELYRNRALHREPSLSFDVNDVRHGLHRRVDHIRATLRSLENLFDGFGERDRLGKCKPGKLDAQTFPAFPDLTFDVDLCTPSEKHKLAEFLSGNNNLAALEAWYKDQGMALDNFGLSSGRAGFYSARNISDAMAKLEDASLEFQNTMAASMKLRYNRREAYGRLVNGLVMSVGIVLGAASAGSGAAVLGALAGATPGLGAHAIESAGKLAPYEQRSVEMADSISQLGGEFDPSNFATGVLSAGGEVMAGKGRDLAAKLEASGGDRQDFTRNIALAMAVLNDDVWKNTLKLLSEEDGFLDDSIRQFNEYRNGLKIEVDRQLEELCKEYAKLRALLPAIERAQAESERKVDPSYWRKLFRNQLGDAELGCLCCRFSDGTGPSGSCKVTLSTAH